MSQEHYTAQYKGSTVHYGQIETAKSNPQQRTRMCTTLTGTYQDEFKMSKDAAGIDENLTTVLPYVDSTPSKRLLEQLQAPEADQGNDVDDSQRMLNETQEGEVERSTTLKNDEFASSQNELSLSSHHDYSINNSMPAINAYTDEIRVRRRMIKQAVPIQRNTSAAQMSLHQNRASIFDLNSRSQLPPAKLITNKTQLHEADAFKLKHFSTARSKHFDVNRDKEAHKSEKVGRKKGKYTKRNLARSQL